MSKLNKIAANPLPIDNLAVEDIANSFMRRLSTVLVSSGLDPITWIERRYEFSPRNYEDAFYQQFEFKHEDVSGRPTITAITIGINPHLKKGEYSTSLIDSETAKDFFNTDDRVNHLQIIFGDDSISDWNLQIQSVRRQAPNTAILNKGVMNLIFRDIYRIAAHELTHAYDVGTTSEKFQKEYANIFDVDKDTPEEDMEYAAGFYYSTREELKAHINQSIAEAIDFIQKYGVETLLNMGFIEFLEIASTTYDTMKHYLTVRPADEGRNTLGVPIARKKQKAWKKYLLTMHTWWESAVEQAKEISEKQITRSMLNSKVEIRKKARIRRKVTLVKTITKATINGDSK